ncbi:MAG: hypothetical protein NXI04_16945 [Planctomycetaceae bacterium]|nr:hypothetical protein [Planctomycetaceae bacterium]
MKMTATTLLVLATLSVPSFGRDYGHVGFPTPGTDELSYPFVTSTDNTRSRYQRPTNRPSRTLFGRRRVSRSFSRPVTRPVSTTPAYQPRRTRTARLFAWVR